MITIIIITIAAINTISSAFTIYYTSWLQSWRLVTMDQVQRDLRRWNQDEKERNRSRGKEWRSSLSSFGRRRALQHWPMPRLFFSFGILYLRFPARALRAPGLFLNCVGSIYIYMDLRVSQQNVFFLENKKKICILKHFKKLCCIFFGYRPKKKPL